MCTSKIVFKIENVILYDFILAFFVSIEKMADTSSTGSGLNQPQMEPGWNALRQHIIDNKIKVGLSITRLFTIIFTIGYIIPIFGYIYYFIVFFYRISRET